MKQKISITVDEKMLEEIEKMLEGARFRNRSHVIEYSLEKFLYENNRDKLNIGKAEE